MRPEPDNISLAGPGARQRFLVTATDAEGNDSDVTEKCRVLSRQPAVIAVDNGSLVGQSPGEAVVDVQCGAIAARTTVKVGASSTAVRVNFAREILSVLTTKGCNSSSCHGSPAGQNGFKLSLYGSDPAADHRMIVETHGGRRINRDVPEKSLLLAKPAFQVAHGGGQLLTPQSDEYRMLLKWLSEGARLDTDGPRFTRLELYPAERVLFGAGARQPLVVVGRLSDGTTRDLSTEVRYAVNDEAVVGPVTGGAVTAKGRGLTTVMARAFGRAATAQFIVIEGGTPGPKVDAANFIDEFVFAKLRHTRIQPFPIAGDHAFIRRVYLDAIGLLPAPEETRAFVSDASPDKRRTLIEKLLARQDYATHWLTKFEDWFRNSQYYSQGRTNGSYKRWLRELIEEDRPYDQAVREMLTATGDTTVRPAGNFWHPAIDFMLKTFDVTKATPTVTRLFLGQRIECAECHNHPLENLTQDDYYGMAATLARIRVKHGYGQYRRVWYDARDGEVLHPVTKKPVAPRFLDGTEPAQADRRQALAVWVTEAQKMQFARATVNRIWAEYFTLGIVDPPDDFRSTNRPTHPELLDRLATYFIDSGFRFKALHRLILNSRTYQLASHTAERPGTGDTLERLLLARYQPRKLPAEVLLDSIVQVTGVPQPFGEYPAGTSPKELVAGIGAPYFLTTFGLPRRDVMERRAEAPSLAQALHLMNSDVLREKVEREDNVLGRLLAAHGEDKPVVEELYLRAYARPPTPAQWDKVQSYLAAEMAAGRTRRRAFENLLWVILNSKEFQLNQ